MEEIKNIVLGLCTALVIGEIIYLITPKNKVSDCVYALIYSVIIINSVFTLIGADFNLDFEDSQFSIDEMNEDINDYYIRETENEMIRIVYGYLDAIGVQYVEATPIVSIVEDSVIVSTIKVQLLYKSDIANAKTVLEHAFNEQIPVEVTGER